MKKIDLGQTIQILANVGVIAGIVFLGFEIRQNNVQLDIQSRGQTDARRFGTVDLVLEQPYLIDLQRKDAKQLTQADRDRLTVMGIRALMNFEEQYRDVVLGRFDRDEALRTQRAIYHRDWLNYGMPLAWITYKERASPEFTRWMEDYVIPQ